MGDLIIAVGLLVIVTFVWISLTCYISCEEKAIEDEWRERLKKFWGGK